MSVLSDLNPQTLAVKALIGIAVIGASFATGGYLAYRHEKLVLDNYVLSQKEAADKQVIANKAALDKQNADLQGQLKQSHQEYTENAQHLQASRDAAIASAADYAGKLQRYLAVSHKQQPSVPGSTASAAGTDAAGESGLSDGVSSLNWYLTQRFSDADGLAIKFNEAVELIAKDRQFCNGSLPGVTPQ